MKNEPPIRKDERIEVRDKRSHPFYTIDNALLRNHGPFIGVYGIAVYNALAMFAGIENEAWPSHETIATLVGMGVRKVSDVIDILIEEGLVRKFYRERPTGGQTSNLYILCAQSNWKIRDAEGEAVCTTCRRIRPN